MSPTRLRNVANGAANVANGAVNVAEEAANDADEAANKAAGESAHAAPAAETGGGNRSPRRGRYSWGVTFPVVGMVGGVSSLV